MQKVFFVSCLVVGLLFGSVPSFAEGNDPLESLRQEKIRLEQDIQKLRLLEQEQEKLLQAKTHRDADRIFLESAFREALADFRVWSATNPSASLHSDLLMWTEEFLSAETYPDAPAVKKLINSLLQEIKQAGVVDKRQGEISLTDGSTAEASILRIGSLLAVAKTSTGQYGYAVPVAGGTRLVLVGNPFGRAEDQLAQDAMGIKPGVYPADFSGGEIFRTGVKSKTFWAHILSGGILVWPILVLGGLAAFFGMIRLLRLMVLQKLDAETLERLYALARSGEFTQCRELVCVEKQNSPIAQALCRMLQLWDGSGISLDKCREAALLGALGPLEKGLGFVSAAAAVTPLLGLLGTVTGMIASFDTITVLGNGDPKLLSGGIAVALVTTELGLIMAVPLLLLHYLLSRAVDSWANDLEESCAVFIAQASAALEKGTSGEVSYTATETASESL